MISFFSFSFLGDRAEKPQYTHISLQLFEVRRRRRMKRRRGDWAARREKETLQNQNPENQRGDETDRIGNMGWDSCSAEVKRRRPSRQQSAAVPDRERVIDEWSRSGEQERRAGAGGEPGELRRKVLLNPFKRNRLMRSFLRGFCLQRLQVMLSPGGGARR